jgi:hypothetical protein
MGVEEKAVELLWQFHVIVLSVEVELYGQM